MTGIMPEREEHKMSEKIEEKTLENATGGSDTSPKSVLEWEAKAKEYFTRNPPVYVPFPCPKCNASYNGSYSVYCAGTTGDISSPASFTYHSAYCFNCDSTLGLVDGSGNFLV